MRIVEARRVLAAARRGSSWPIITETDEGIWFTKLRGAAQGTAPLVAEVIVASLAEALGLSVPARALVSLDAGVTSNDRNDELADLLRASAGINLGFAYLEGAQLVMVDDLSSVSPGVAAAILWLDGLVMNPDRTARNTNLLAWRDRLWLIDHGASLGFQYSWASVDEAAPRRPWATREHHALHSLVPGLAAHDDALAARISRQVLEAAVAEVPDSFLEPLIVGRGAAGDALPRRRAAYVAFLWKKLKPPRPFLLPALLEIPDLRRGRPSWLRRGG